MKSNQSIIARGYHCYLCEIIDGVYNIQDLQLHHIFHGTANRKNADKWGCYCYLCPSHHLYGEDAVHRDSEIDLGLKKIAQLRFEQEYSHEKFMEVFGKNYL